MQGHAVSSIDKFCKNLRVFWFVFGVYVRQSFYHKSSASAMIITWIVRVGLTVLLYGSIYKLIGQTTIKNITFDVAVSGMLFFAIYGTFGIRELNRVITQEYKSGSLEIWFTKPLPYLLLKLAEVIGRNIPAVLGLSLVMIFYWSLAHHNSTVDHMVIRLIWCAVLLLIGLVLMFCIYSLVGLSAVFLTESKPVFFVVDKLVMTFGGIYIPIGFFSPGFRFFGEILPTGATTYGAQLFYPDFFDNLPRFIVTQCVWIAVLGWFLLIMSKRVDKYLTVNGG
jgi:ABC-type uncharacterized transport system permease subunit